jgi:integrase
MPAAPPGIKKVPLPGRIGRNGKRIAGGVRWEVKAYNRQTKKTQYVRRFPTLAEAVAAKARFEQAHGGSGPGAARMTFDELVNVNYLKRTMTLGRKPRPIKESTITTNRAAVQPFVADFGAMRVGRLEEDVLIAWCQTQPGFVVEGLRAMFSWAYRRRIVRENPMAFVDSRRGEGRKHLLVISDEDLRLLVEAAPKCWPDLMGLRLAVLLELLAHSGMRPSEAFALRPEHIDFERRRIYLDWQLDGRGRLQELKNCRKREVVMADEVIDACRRLLPKIDGNDLLFQTVTGRKLNSKSKWSYYWDPIRKMAGLSNMQVYELRHYFATLVVNRGARSEDVAEQLGHSDGGELVRNLYGHPDKRIRLANLEDVMRNRTGGIARRLERQPPQGDQAARELGADAHGEGGDGGAIAA